MTSHCLYGLYNLYSKWHPLSWKKTSGRATQGGSLSEDGQTCNRCLRLSGHLIKVLSLSSGSMTSISVLSEFRSRTFSDTHLFTAYKQVRCMHWLYIPNYSAGSQVHSGCFLLPFFHNYFLLSHTLGHHKLIISTHNLEPFVLRGQENPFFGKSFQLNDVIAYIKVLQLHKWSDKSEIVHGVSWHIGGTTRITFRGLLPFYFQISPSVYPKRQKKNEYAWQIVIKGNHFQACYDTHHCLTWTWKTSHNCRLQFKSKMTFLSRRLKNE